jgi:uncharacterized protein YndB with AHSA1/START domain
MSAIKSDLSAAQKNTAQHDTFVIERELEFSPAQVFAAWADPVAKARWFSGTAGQWKELVRESDFRVGGRERVNGAWASGPVSKFDAHYLDIVPDRRIVYSYVMHIDERKISASLATVEFKPAGTGTRMIITEQGAFLDGYDDAGSRERGTQSLMDNLAASLRNPEV